MGAHKSRDGSLQIWPRKRAEKFLPSVNWRALKTDTTGLMGFIAYKVGMTSCLVKDLTADSMTKDKKITIPASVLEVPSLKIYSVRLYKDNLCVGEIILNSDKELKRVLKIGKSAKIGKIEEIDKRISEIDDIKVIVYSQVKNTGIKKTPDIIEVGIGGKLEEKIEFVKQHANKEIHCSEILKKNGMVDVRGLSKGHGFEGPVKRFGISLKGHKSEKGRRRPGSLGPWHPHHVVFRVAQAGQLGMQTRINYNSSLVEIGKISEKNINPKQGWSNFGNIKTEYVIVRGSVPGPAKRQLLLTSPLRATKSSSKKKYEFIKLE
ncbi:MAG: 50S ribosomal protein L3 [Nanoarchaeota archaeon]|nr:50S ribosomal protein L3 [Nanoarchaeota archaeon]MBU4086588.1 50S ribosomal protein L3 [Nanoarchaeota archaeon]